MTSRFQTGVLILLPLLLQLIGLTFAVIIDPYLLQRRRRLMLINNALLFALIAQNYTGFLLDQNGTLPYIRTIVGVFGYCVRPVVIVLFFYIVTPERRYNEFWALLVVNATIHMTALFSGICFSIDATNTFHRGPLGYSCHVTSAICLAYLTYLTIRKYHQGYHLEIAVPIFNAVLIAVSVVMDSFVDYRNFPVNYMTIAAVSSCLFYYIWLHLQFVREHEHALQAEQRIQIMMTQIQPHFLFNALNTIRALYTKDPPLADKTLENFSTYLRQNLESLGQPERIPIAKELEHTRLYAEIEMLRFPNIYVEYQIEDSEFTIPALTIQPLVENAIQHGVRGRRNGHVTVSVIREEDGHQIIIRDNGVGFDPEQRWLPEESHIGLQNVRDRVEQMCGGTMELASELGVGTTVTMHIPEPRAGREASNDSHLRG